METIGSSVNDSQLREELVRNLKQFSLSYEQHQLIHSSDFGPLVARLTSKRRAITTGVVILAFFSAFQAVRGLLASSTVLPWLVGALVAAHWAYRRYKKTSRLASAYEAYASTVGEVASAPSSLANELKLGFSLEYPEFQAIRAGKAYEAARGIINRRRANSRNFAIGTVVLSIVAVAIWGLLGVAFAVLLILGLSVSLIIDHSVISRVERLLERYTDDKPEFR